MTSDVSPGKTIRIARQFLGYSRANIRNIVSTAAVVIVIVELGGIWNEVRQMRREQVKNAMYALSTERRNAIQGSARSKRLESTTFVDGSVEIEGEVQLAQPVEVDIDQ